MNGELEREYAEQLAAAEADRDGWKRVAEALFGVEADRDRLAADNARLVADGLDVLAAVGTLKARLAEAEQHVAALYEASDSYLQGCEEWVAARAFLDSAGTP